MWSDLQILMTALSRYVLIYHFHPFGMLWYGTNQQPIVLNWFNVLRLSLRASKESLRFCNSSDHLDYNEFILIKLLIRIIRLRWNAIIWLTETFVANEVENSIISVKESILLGTTSYNNYFSRKSVTAVMQWTRQNQSLF